MPKYFDKTADSGSVRRMAFCGECGTHLCSLPEEEGSFLSIRVATSYQFSNMKPTAQIYCLSRVDWMPAMAGTVEFEREGVAKNERFEFEAEAVYRGAA